MSTKAVKVWLPEEQAEALKRLALERGESVSALIRRAVEMVYGTPDPERRREALRRLFSLEAPVDEWPRIEEEIERAATEE